jgi:hypothetical protein
MTDLRQQIEDAWTSADEQSSAQPQTVATSENNNEPAPAEPTEVITAPNSYKQDFKDSFNQLPTEWQKYLATREKEVEQGLSKARNQYSWVDKVYNDRREALAAQGYNSAQDYINDLVLISDALAKDPTATLEALRSNYGVEASGQENNALQRQLMALQQTVNQQQSYLNAQRQESIMNALNAFMNAKDESGNAKHIYFDDVRDEMVALLKSGLAKDYEDAYNQAVWRVESVRNKMIAAQAKAELEQKTATAQKAKTAAFEPTSKTEGTPKKLSLREELERNMAMFGE